MYNVEAYRNELLRRVTDNKMRLSEAIKLGAMLRPQGFGDIFPDGKYSCAWGSALEAIGLAITPESMEAMEATGLSFVPEFWGAVGLAPMPESWFWTRSQSQCPQCGAHRIGLRSVLYVCNIITHLNDAHRWTRERIADWVATIEPKEDAECAAQHETKQAEMTTTEPSFVSSGA